MRNGPSAPAADETRSRLLDAAHCIFAELGFQGATTRMICERAEANPAAVNYHFGDKLGLYTEVLKSNFGSEELKFDNLELLESDPEAALREFISRFFNGLMSLDGKHQCMRLMGHEFSQPTIALATVVDQIARPVSRVLCEIISRITGSPPQSVAAILACQSIIAQVTQYTGARPILNLLWTECPGGAGSTEEIVAHITRFSLGGLRALQDESKATMPAAPSRQAARRGSQTVT